ncbi:MAG: enoyl-CoA hydratase-related protein [Chloroflexi bacterium]|nr:enoyl-CoA hydratase-related protein [Chloroflexota bacterium]
MELNTASSIGVSVPSVRKESEVPALCLVLRNDADEDRITPDLIVRLTQSLELDRESPLVTVEGGPGSFCSGFDLTVAISPGIAHDILDHFAHLLEMIERTPRPVIALVDGAAMGAGVGLAAAADIVLASPRASFSLPETIMGLIPATVFPYVARRMGVAQARMLALGASPLNAVDALKFGLVDQVTEDLESALRQHARRLIRADARATAALKALVADHYGSFAAYQREAIARFSALAESESTRERIARFLEGETPWT